MEARKLEPEEQWMAGLGFAVAFETPFDLDAEKEKCAQLDDAEKEARRRDARQTWGVFSEDGSQLYGSVDVTRFPVRFDGGSTLMGGIGGVQSFPPCRRKGAIRKSLQAAFAAMYEEGCGFAYLYPFSHAYYRKFGFESAAKEETWTIELSALRTEDVGGSIEMLYPGEEQSALLDIYNSFSAAYNLSVLREEYDKQLLKARTLQERRYGYLWRDGDGVPGGFFLYRKKDGILDCTCSFECQNTFLFRDRKALNGLLHFVKTAFGAQNKAIRLNLPERFPIDAFIGEGNGAECMLAYHGMARVINAGEVLRLCRCLDRNGEGGSLDIALKDEQIPENSGVWSLTWKAGRPNRVEKRSLPEEEADVVMDIRDFTVLILGIRDWEDAAFLPGVTVNRKEEQAACVFYRKKNHVLNLF